MYRVQTVFRTLLLVAMLGLVAGGQAVAAQSLDRSGDSWVSGLTGAEITFSSDWEVAREDVSPDGENEVIVLEADEGALLIGFGATDDVETSILSTIEDIDGAEMVEGANEADFAWGLGHVADPGSVVRHIYVEAENGYADDFQFVAGLLGGDGFIDLFDLAQETVSVDGGYVFVEHDTDELQALIGDSADVDERSTPEGEGNVTETGGPGREAGSSEDSEAYTYEHADLEVIVSEPVTISDVQIEDDSYEQMLLVGNGGVGTVSLINNAANPSDTLNGFMSGFTGEMDVAEEIDSGVEGDVAWTLYRVSFDGADMYVYATADGGRFADMHLLQLLMAPDDMFEDQFTEFQESVRVNDDDMFAGVDVADLLRLVEGS